MRKFTAIIICIAFIASQYANHVSYLECRLANYFTLPAEKCDCEKLLAENKVNNNEPAPPARHNHIHIDESYCLFVISFQKPCAGNILLSWSPYQADYLIEGTYGTIDHPPQVD